MFNPKCTHEIIIAADRKREGERGRQIRREQRWLKIEQYEEVMDKKKHL